MEKWRNGKMEKWKNGKMEKWRNGENEKRGEPQWFPFLLQVKQVPGTCFTKTLQPYNLTTLQSMLPYLAMGVFSS
jgi:hypothetical protein